MTDQPNTLELYRIMVATITANEGRRQQASAVYMSLVSAGVAVLGAGAVNPYFVLLPIMAIAAVWFVTIRYFRALAQAKFAVIVELEREWHIRPFAMEWQHLKENWRWRGLELSNIETYLPVAVFVLALGYAVWLGAY